MKRFAWRQLGTKWLVGGLVFFILIVTVAYVPYSELKKRNLELRQAEERYLAQKGTEANLVSGYKMKIKAYAVTLGNSYGDGSRRWSLADVDSNVNKLESEIREDKRLSATALRELLVETDVTKTALYGYPEIVLRESRQIFKDFMTSCGGGPTCKQAMDKICRDTLEQFGVRKQEPLCNM